MSEILPFDSAEEAFEFLKERLIRLFYFLFSVCLYNLWVLINICVSIIIHGKVLDKPVITAKMFAIVLYKVYVDSG